MLVYDQFVLRLSRASLVVPTWSAVLAGLLAVLLVPSGQLLGQAPAPYTIISPEGRRSLAVRMVGSNEAVQLDLVANLFGLKVTEDTLADGLVIEARGQRIIAVPGQSFVQAAGRVVQLSGPIQRAGNTWVVPLDFLPLAVGPAVGQRIVLRRPSRLLLVGDVRVPQISARAEKTQNGGRIVVDIQPGTPNKVTRDGNRLIVRFDATALDPGPIVAQVPEFAAGARIEGTSLVFTLGPATADFRAEGDRDDSSLTIDLMTTPPPPVAGAPTAKPLDPPVIDLSPGTIRTVVIDPGHGGNDEGVRGAGGAKEKDIVLQVARRLKGTIEGRLGLRVLLTREGDEDVPVDRRTSLANNNKADLFLSLHANASVRPTVRGAQVLSLSKDDYEPAGQRGDPRRDLVPVVGGAMRNIEPVPWNLAQLPFAGRSAALGAILVQHLNERQVPLYGRPAMQMPLRVLVGANMPAVLIEMGFLSNATDEKALTGGQLPGEIIEAILLTVAEVRRGIPDLTQPPAQTPPAAPGRGGK